MYKAMTIAGSDTSGGAGMEADLKTFQELGVYGMTALTCIVAQNPNADWAHEIYPIETAVIEKQLVTILQGISIPSWCRKLRQRLKNCWLSGRWS